ncbi:AMP-binding protein [Rhodopseudomonas palustris]|uniref:Long-chain fatty acid--CoA ligase n=1 Tax=Rhodopseudomonas palustris TaxID=1076 RepID=A0A418V1H7_RHOPL|nr:AMP-binding protein [Rhodopseudomonas palustris]RJF69755.1 long-chain fatty acid--CoA ligase [Rhodopseudomonas palustris]
MSADTQDWVLPRILQTQGQSRPDALWLKTVDGDSLTFGAAAIDARRIASYLATSGVKPGDPVAVLMPNGTDIVRSFMGIGTLGAVAVMLNTELRGAFLQHQLTNCGAGIAIVDPSLLGAVLEVADKVGSLRTILVADDCVPAARAGCELISWKGWRDAAPYDGPLPSGHDIACIMYTSGTSGPSKGVLMPHAHCTLYGVGQRKAMQLHERDVFYICVPLFHANGLLMQLGASLQVGIPAVIRQRFSASNWISDIREHGCTVTNSLGALAAFVVVQPPQDSDRDNALRAVCNAPNLPAHDAEFRRRFGVKDVLSGFGMTEVNIPIWGRLGQSAPGAAGWVHDEHFELIIADPETDQRKPPGELGEILVRPKLPFGFMAGYHNMPDRTVEAWRNLWFHTGDAAIMDADGLVTFVDRIKDCIRRRGENIAASEVEEALGDLAGIEEVAAYAVPSSIPGGEDELMLAIVPAPGAALDVSAITSHADKVLPRFAAPRYIEFVGELPKTATGKVQRAVLRKRGAATAWDREAGR